jgi:hypothetical protein
VFILDSLLVGGLRFILDKIAVAADAEAQDDTALREQLLEAQMRLEMGEISEAECAAIEREIFARLRKRRGGPQEALTMSPGSSVDVEGYPPRG